MPDIRYCTRCNKLFNKFYNGKLCPECIKELDELMLKIKEYLEKRPDADISGLSESLEIREKDVFYLLREERLSLKTPNTGYHCLRCGETIDCGKYCDKCIQHMKNEFKNAAAELKKLSEEETRSNVRSQTSHDQKGKMHTAFRRGRA